MKITVFTSNQPRHLSLIKDLSAICDEVYAVLEVNTVFPGKREDFFKKSEVMQRYFSNVIQSEKKIFGDISVLPSNVRVMAVKSGDLNDIPLDVLEPLLNSDEYVVFGSSYIKSPLVDFLISKNAYNIHMGVSPYYRGSSCNFWAAYDRNITMVGATIHLLTKGLDSGPMLFHALPEPAENIFDLGMKAVKSAHTALIHYLSSGEIKHLKPVVQDKTLEIRYTRNADFNDEVALQYLSNLPTKEEIYESFSKLDPSKYLRLFRI